MEQWELLSILGCRPCQRRGRFDVRRGVGRPAGVRRNREGVARVGVFLLIVVLIAARDVDGVDYGEVHPDAVHVYDLFSGLSSCRR
eukprot:6173666-Pleurochrysis_carterae.AAC.2